MSMIEQYRILHASGRYMNVGLNKAPFILPHVEAFKPRSVVDYGSGKGRISDLILNLYGSVKRTAAYDPAVPGRDTKPEPCDLLISIDMLEHVPEDELDDVLSDMKRLAPHAVLIIGVTPATTILPNGENAHATVKPASWWRSKIIEHYGHASAIPIQGRELTGFRTWPLRASEWPYLLARIAYHRARRRGYKRQITIAYGGSTANV